MRNLSLRWSRVTLLAALLLSGCFRPAGDSIEPTLDTTGETIVNPGASATSDSPPITLLSPETDATDLSPTTDSGPALTPVTLAPPTASATATEPPGEGTPTLQIITPGIPLGLVTPDTPLPQPTSLATLANLAAETDEAGEAGIAAVDSAGDCTYTIQPGDSLYGIAVEYGTTVVALREANPDLEGNPPILQIEQVLFLPDCLPGTPRPTRVTPTVAPNATEEPEATDDVPDGSQIHIVQPGDVLGAIATRYRVTVNAIMRANDLTDPNVLSIGQRLIIPPPATPSS